MVKLVEYTLYRDFCEQSAQEIIAILQKALLKADRASLVLSGGSSPKGVYQALSQIQTDNFWSCIDFFIGDDRFINDGDERSNFKMIAETLFTPLNIKKSQIFSIDKSLPIKEATRKYNLALEAYLLKNKTFDLTLLGMGPDGHTASLFPFSKGLNEKDLFAFYTDKEAPLPPFLRRVTMGYKALLKSQNVKILSTGKEKRPIIQSLISREREILNHGGVFPSATIQKYPIAGLFHLPKEFNLEWIYTEKK